MEFFEKNRTIAIGLITAVVLCCCCSTVLLFYYVLGDPIMNALGL